MPSLTESTIVAMTIGAVAMIAGPSLSRGSSLAEAEILRSDLAAVRAAIRLYAQDHAGALPPAERLNEALSSPSNGAPYLEAIPALRVGPNRGASRIASAPGAGVGWVLDRESGRVLPNAPADVLDRLDTNEDDQ